MAHNTYQKTLLWHHCYHFVNEQTNSMLIFQNVESKYFFFFFFFGCVVILDLYLFQEIVLLNPCFIFFKNLMLSFIDKVTTGR